MNSRCRIVEIAGTLWTLLLVSGNAVAQASPPPCDEVNVDEVFVGAPGCEDADYVMVSLRVDSDWPSMLDLGLSNACGQDEVQASYELAEQDDEDASQRSSVLVAGPDFERFFGIQPDVVLDRPSPLSRSGGSIWACDVSVDLDFKQTRLLGEEALIPGDGSDGGTGWTPATPRPLNRNGEIGTLRGCGGNDGGIVPPAQRLACGPLAPVEGGVPTPDEAGVTSEPTESADETATEPPDDRLDAGPTRIEEPTSETMGDDPVLITETLESGVSNTVGETSNEGGSAGASTATTNDAGKQGGVQLRELNGDERSDGCSCSVGSRQPAGSALGALLAVALGWSQRRRRVTQAA